MIALLRHLRIPHEFSPSRRAAIGTLALIAWSAVPILSTVPAFSAAQTPAASDEPDATNGEAPETRAKSPGSGPIVLVLPLDSPSFRRAAQAVQAGFLAAAEAARTPVVVIPHGDDDVLAAFGKAISGDARVIVGPLVRDDLKTIVNAKLPLPPTIALNQLDETSVLPEHMYALSLTLDSDARQLAHRARDEGAATVAVIVSDSPLQQRFASAFNAEWILAGGDAPVTFRFDRAPDVLRTLRQNLIKARFDAALLAIDGADAALAKSYVKSTPTYTSSQVNERQPREVLRDLDDVRFVDIPWLVDPDATAFAGLKRQDYPNAALDRLYALGIDAFRVAQAFADGAPSRLELEGATGRLTLDSARQFVREGRLMVFRAGQMVPVAAR